MIEKEYITAASIVTSFPSCQKIHTGFHPRSDWQPQSSAAIIFSAITPNFEMTMGGV
jgi:hypothetical protein